MGSDLFKSRHIIKVTANGDFPISWGGGRGVIASTQSEGTLTLQRKLAGQGSFQAVDSTNLIISGAGAGADIGFTLGFHPETGQGGDRDDRLQINIAGATTFPFFVTVQEAPES